MKRRKLTTTQKKPTYYYNQGFNLQISNIFIFFKLCYYKFIKNILQNPMAKSLGDEDNNHMKTFYFYNYIF